MHDLNLNLSLSFFSLFSPFSSPPPLVKNRQTHDEKSIVNAGTNQRAKRAVDTRCDLTYHRRARRPRAVAVASRSSGGGAHAGTTGGPVCARRASGHRGASLRDVKGLVGKTRERHGKDRARGGVPHGVACAAAAGDRLWGLGHDRVPFARQIISGVIL